ncbi:MlaD family protein [Desulfonatronovibrio magnus]|uniref:MlaD family protein n=1 Tax=Desulfonatronovibrio magnus TaxID=698827 RepID=UPI0005EBBC37|nr:MlaD family protein [Desulfonatronovibrio magnus]
MRTGPNYYTIGIFVSIGIILIFAALIILGAGALWRVHVVIETYVDESIQGIDIGSQVKMRGVQIGNVQQVSFVNIKYPEAHDAQQRYVLLEISLSLKSFGDITPEEFQQFLAQEVLEGLRIRMLPMGITGSAYIEMDYMDPARHPPLPIDWTPEYPYVPSAPGTFTRLEETFESLSNTMAKLEKLEFQKTLGHLDNLIVNLNDTVSSLNIHDLTEQTALFLQELRESNRRVSALLGPEKTSLQDISIYSMLAETEGLIKDVRKSFDSFAKHETFSPDNFAEIIANVQKASEALPATIQNMHKAADSVRESTAGFNALTRNTYSLMRSQNERIESIMRDMQITSSNLMELSSDAKRYPSFLLFGDKPLESDLK